MPSSYCVIQYVPNPIADERINIGVIAYNEDTVSLKFTENFRRIRSFGREDVSFIRDFITDLEQSSDLQQRFFETHTLNQQLIEKFVKCWRNSIQLTTPRASLLPPNDALEKIAPLFLPSYNVFQRKNRDKRAAVSLAIKAIRNAIGEQATLCPPNILKRGVTIQGRHDEHKFDLGSTNGQLLFAAQGFSFEAQETNYNLSRDVDATAWQIEDVKKVDSNLPLAIVVLPPKDESKKIYTRAVSIFEGLGANIVREEQVPPWAKDMAEKIVSHCAH